MENEELLWEKGKPCPVKVGDVIQFVIDIKRFFLAPSHKITRIRDDGVVDFSTIDGGLIKQEDAQGNITFYPASTLGSFVRSGILSDFHFICRKVKLPKIKSKNRF
jgi:hypothetical protein